MPQEDSEEERPKKWKHKELSRRIRWTGPTLPSPPSDLPPEQRWKKAPDPSPQSPFKALLGLAPTKAEIEEHQRAWNDASSKYVDEQLRKLPLLAQEYDSDVPNDAWVRIAERNEAWVLSLVLVLAQQLVPGFMLDVGERRGARVWDEVAQAGLIADVEAIRARRGCGDSEACSLLLKLPQYKERYGKNPKKQSLQKRAKILNSRLVDARTAESLIARMLAEENGTAKLLVVNSIISSYGCDPSDREEARARADALKDELEEPRAKRSRTKKRSRPAKKTFTK